MISIVTSCISPQVNLDAPKSFFSLEEREEQTLHTLQRLNEVGFEKIVLVDNSAHYDFSKIKSYLNGLEIVYLKQFQFENKGLNELLMLLAIVEDLPNNEPIFKLSGRYYPNEEFDFTFDEQYDFKIKTYAFASKKGTISTRGYFVKNKVIFKDFLLKTLNEVFIYPNRIVGARSFINQIAAIFNPKFSNYIGTSIEFAAARVIKAQNYKISLIERIGVEGKIAGFKELNFIKE